MQMQTQQRDVLPGAITLWIDPVPRSGYANMAADELLAGVTPDMDPVQQAKAIYHAVSTRMVYDDSALTEFERKRSASLLTL